MDGRRRFRVGWGGREGARILLHPSRRSGPSLCRLRFVRPRQPVPQRRGDDRVGPALRRYMGVGLIGRAGERADHLVGPVDRRPERRHRNASSANSGDRFPVRAERLLRRRDGP